MQILLFLLYSHCEYFLRVYMLVHHICGARGRISTNLVSNVLAQICTGKGSSRLGLHPGFWHAPHRHDRQFSSSVRRQRHFQTRTQTPPVGPVFGLVFGQTPNQTPTKHRPNTDTKHQPNTGPNTDPKHQPNTNQTPPVQTSV